MRKVSVQCTMQDCASQMRNHALSCAFMEMPDRIAAAETRAKRIGLTVKDLCQAADCHRATWQRWKAGKGEPSVSQWERVERHIEAAAERAAA